MCKLQGYLAYYIYFIHLAKFQSTEICTHGAS